MKDTNRFALLIFENNLELITLDENVKTPWCLAKKILGDVNLEVVGMRPPFTHDFAGIVHEEGKPEGLEKNDLATACCGSTLYPGDYIAGPMIVCVNDSHLSGLDKANFHHFDFFMTVARNFFRANTEQQSSS